MPAVRQSLRHGASFKQQPAVEQSLRHGLRPCHLPLTREAKPPQTLRRRNLCRGRCLHRSGGFAAAQGSAGGYGIRPYGLGQTPRPTANPTPPRTPRRGAHCAPGNPAAAQTPAGGINPAPTNKFGASRKPERRNARCKAIPPSRPSAVPPPFDKGGKTAAKPVVNREPLRRRAPGVGAHIVRPGNPAAAQTPRAG